MTKNKKTKTQEINIDRKSCGRSYTLETENDIYTHLWCCVVIFYYLLCYIENHLKVRRDDKDHKRHHHTCWMDNEIGNNMELCNLVVIRRMFIIIRIILLCIDLNDVIYKNKKNA